MAVFVADEQSDPVDTDRLRLLAGYVLQRQGVPESMELSVLCVGRDAIAALNGTHMGADGPTDVLAFPMDLPGETRAGEPAILGDVVLCPAVAARQAAQHASTPQAEVDMLLVHGILHLLGYDHRERGEREEMFALTRDLLDGFARGRDGA